MKRFIILSIMCVFAVTATSYCQSGESKSTTISDDVRTMSRLIGGELNKEFPEKYLARFGSEQRCMGVYLENYGAVFIAHLPFPIFDYHDTKSEKKSKPDDLWNKYKNDTEQDAFGVVHKQDSKDRMNQQVDRVKRLKDFLVEIICNYAGNLKWLPSDEYVTIAVKGSRNPEYPFFEVVAKGDDKDKPDEKPTHLTIQRTKSFTGQSVSGVRGSSGDYGQHLIMKIKKKDISGDCADKIEISFN